MFLADVWRMGGGEGFRHRAVTPLQEVAGVGLEGDLGGLSWWQQWGWRKEDGFGMRFGGNTNQA